MALDTTVEFLGVDDCKIFAITTDTAEDYAVGTGIDFPVKSFSYTPEIESKSLYQDERTYDRYSNNKETTVQLTSGSLSQPVMAALLGGTVTSAGTTPAEVSTYAYNGGVIDKYVQIAFQVKYVNGAGDLHVHFMKAKVDSIDSSGNAEEYGEISITLKAIPTTYDFTNGNMMQIKIEETEADIVAIEPA